MQYWLFGVPACIILSYAGYKYISHCINNYIAEKIKKFVDTEVPEDFFRPVHNYSASISFISGGQKYNVFVPYNRKKSTRYLGKKVYLEKGDEMIDITQKPGVAYMVSANDLGGEWIVVKDREGKVIKRFSGQEIPHMF